MKKMLFAAAIAAMFVACNGNTQSASEETKAAVDSTACCQKDSAACDSAACDSLAADSAAVEAEVAE